MVDLEDRMDELSLHIGAGARVQVGNSEQVIVVQDVRGDTEFFRYQAHGGDAPALSVTPIVHLDKGLQHVAGGDLLGAGHADNAAAALGRLVARQQNRVDFWQSASCGDNTIN